MALRKNLTLILGIVIAAFILVQVAVRGSQLNRTDAAVLDSKIEQFSSL